jgi:alpha-beta hydrolase superfamily lysophospholipase
MQPNRADATIESPNRITMKLSPARQRTQRAPNLAALLLRRPRWLLRGVLAALATMTGVTSLEVQQRRWIFQAGLANSAERAQASIGLLDRWITFDSEESGVPATLHGLWLPQPHADAPVMLYLHGARWDIRNSAQRMRSLHELGFSVLGIDYRGFGQSTAALPSERMAIEDACAAWRWLAQQHPQARRYIYGHSLGGAIAVHLASQVDDAAGLIVEGTFTSIPEVIASFKWGWRPLAALITQRFDSAQCMPHVKVPTLVVHGSADAYIRPELGRALFERATSPKRFMLVPGGAHHDTHAVGRAQYREALHELFGLSAAA